MSGGHGAVPKVADVVIVGAGSSGCVLAEKLSRDGSRSVVLLERGPDQWPGPEVLGLGRLPIESGSRFAIGHQSQPGPPVVRGRGLGGSSVINGGYFLRWHPEDFSGWPTGWDLPVIEGAYDELDGPHGTMCAAPFDDHQLGDLAAAFESYWSARVAVRPVSSRWPVVGLNRVVSNSVAGRRVSAAQAYLHAALGRTNLTVLAGYEVDDLVIAAGRDVTGVRAGDLQISAGEVILCAGTLGTAQILLRSGIEVLGAAHELQAAEHRGVAVTYRRRKPATSGPLLPTVVHTPDGHEIRCYRDDLAAFIADLPFTAPMIEVTAMHHAPVCLRPGETGARVEFGEVDAPLADALARTAGEVVDMLSGPEFADIVEAGSAAVVPGFTTSQHAWGSMPMGTRTDWLGGVYGTRGLRIVDGSILPTGGRSGPHATIMMVAFRIADQLSR